MFEPFLFLARKRNASPVTAHIWCVWYKVTCFVITYNVIIMYTQKRKSAARLGRLRLQGALALRSFHHEAMLHDEKSPVTSRWLCELPWKKIFRVSYLFNSSKTLGFSEHRKGGYAAALGEPTSEHAVFNI